ncbi:MAG: hypothetical protein MJY72_04715 [Bacteroidales bacterium]|nr:hypothetical protein [Bacteroidales bacterium]
MRSGLHITISILACCAALASCTKPYVPHDYNPYMVVKCTEVLEYCPAPGQFIGDGYEAKTMEEACEHAYQRMSENKYVSLGAFGGYIVAKLEHSIVPSDGFIIVVGNFTESSSEPGIVYVMEDKNGNGLPDEEWVEIKGSLYGSSEETRDYSVTYYRPADIHSDVRWTDNQGGEGLILYNDWHKQDSYYPQWISEDSYTLSGPRLASRAYDSSDNGSMWINPSYGSGYADNFTIEDVNFIDAVNKENKNFLIPRSANVFSVPRECSQVSFVKVQCAVQDECGWIGEVSTEVCGIYGLQCFFLE